MKRFILPGLTALVLIAAPVAAQQRHWLRGTWEGKLENMPPAAKAGPERTLVVKQVAPNGQGARGQLIVNGKPAEVNIKIEGDTITFGTPGASGVMHQLARKEDSLRGTWTIRNLGKTGPMWLKRK